MHYKKLGPDFDELDTSLQETIKADSCSVSYAVVHSNILSGAYLNMSPTGLNLLETRMKIFKKAYFKKPFL